MFAAGIAAVRPYLYGPLELWTSYNKPSTLRNFDRHEFGSRSFHVEVKIGDSVLVIEAGKLPPEVSPWVRTIYVYVEDVDAVYASV